MPDERALKQQTQTVSMFHVTSLVRQHRDDVIVTAAQLDQSIGHHDRPGRQRHRIRADRVAPSEHDLVGAGSRSGWKTKP
jgi:hypothetical protein